MSAALKTAELPPEALSFIKEGAPKVVNQVSPSDPPAASSVSPSLLKPNEVEIQVKPKTTPKQSAAIPASLVGLSFRLPAEIHNALMRASFDRKMQRQEPWTQQEIAAEALGVWLKKQGYL